MIFTHLLGAAASSGESLSWYDSMLYPFMWVLGWVLKLSHSLLISLGMSDGPGYTWVFAIVLMTVLVRAVLVPLFIKQIRGGRAMQMAQPELMKLREKYKGQRDQASQMKMMEESKAIQRKYGASASASCLPALVQLPIFFALYRVLYNLEFIAKGTFAEHDSIGGMNQQAAQDLWESKFFGVSLGQTFLNNATGHDRLVIGLMVLYLVVTMFIQTKYLTVKNMSDEQLNSDNPMMRSTKMMLYTMPAVYLITGPVVQFGLLVYWVVSNTWQLVQQFFLVRAYPMRGSAAARWRQEAHEIKFEKYRAAEEEALQKKIEQIQADTSLGNAQAIESAIRTERRAHLTRLSKRRMELGLDDTNLGSIDSVGQSGQRMQPGRKGWEEYRAQFADLEQEDEVVESPAEAVGKDGLTASQRAQKQAERRAAQRKAAAQKRKKKAKQAENK